MYIRRKVFSVAVDQATGEEKLFSVNEVQQRDYSSKAQKALRNAYDIQKGKDFLDWAGVRGGYRRFNLKQLGRKQSQSRNYPLGINASINAKSVVTPITTGRSAISEIAEGKAGLKHYQKMFPNDKERITSIYDHGKGFDIEDRIKTAKTIMKNVKGL
jgi:hypothetical protein